MLLTGCVKHVDLMENRIIEPSDYACKCEGIVVTDMMLVGKAKLARMIERLEWCKSNALIGDK